MYLYLQDKFVLNLSYETQNLVVKVGCVGCVYIIRLGNASKF